MMSISSAAGKRLAKAKVVRDHIPDDGKDPIEQMKQRREFILAAEALADELIAQRFHEMEGD